MDRRLSRHVPETERLRPRAVPAGHGPPRGRRPPPDEPFFLGLPPRARGVLSRFLRADHRAGPSRRPRDAGGERLRLVSVSAHRRAGRIWTCGRADGGVLVQRRQSVGRRHEAALRLRRLRAHRRLGCPDLRQAARRGRVTHDRRRHAASALRLEGRTRRAVCQRHECRHDPPLVASTRRPRPTGPVHVRRHQRQHDLVGAERRLSRLPRPLPVPAPPGAKRGRLLLLLRGGHGPVRSRSRSRAARVARGL